MSKSACPCLKLIENGPYRFLSGRPAGDELSLTVMRHAVTVSAVPTEMQH